MKDLLSNLPCFTQVESISKIASGLSQQCFRVDADNKIYFAKTFSNNTEVSVAICAGKSGLSSNVIYHDQHWLITNFIDADNLELNTIESKDKINHAVKLMVQCHQLNVKPAELSAKDAIKSLINNIHLPKSQKVALSQLAELIIEPLNISRNDVCCHGDLNFSNVLIDLKENTWLVDYECACNAPVEYDLAMFIAVNNLPSDEITMIIEQYEVHSSFYVDLQLLNHYLLFCYFINALWYFNAYHKKALIEDTTEDTDVLFKHAQKQWYAFHSLIKVDDSPLLSRLSSKLTDILSTFDFSNQT